MRKPSFYRTMTGFLMLLGLLFHLFVTHADGFAEVSLIRQANGHILIENALEHEAVFHLRQAFALAGPVYLSAAEVSATTSTGHTLPAHRHLQLEHPDVYPGPLRWVWSERLLLPLLHPTLPVWFPSEAVPGRLAYFTRPQPPPSQWQRAHLSTVLLI